MGRLVIRSADPEKGLTLKREALEAMFPLHQGDIFDISKVRKAIENYTKALWRLWLYRFHRRAASRRAR